MEETEYTDFFNFSELIDVVNDMKNDWYKKNEIEWNDLFSKINDLSWDFFEEKNLTFSFWNLTDNINDMMSSYIDCDNVSTEEFVERIRELED